MRRPRSDVIMRRFMAGESLVRLAECDHPIWRGNAALALPYAHRYCYVQDALRREMLKSERRRATSRRTSSR